jgi:hypothetical protein
MVAYSPLRIVADAAAVLTRYDLSPSPNALFHPNWWADYAAGDL